MKNFSYLIELKDTIHLFFYLFSTFIDATDKSFQSPSTPDIWLEKSLERSEKQDPDFQPSVERDENESKGIRIDTSRAYNMEKDNVYFVYESQLEKLLKVCSECGQPIISTKKIENEGTQYRRRMTCLGGCETEWSSQPKSTNFKG